MKILFLVRSLNYGGNERQVVHLAKGLKERGHSIMVAVFYMEGGLERELIEAQVRLHQLDKRGRWDAVQFFFRMLLLLRREKPDVLYSFLAIPNILALFATALFPSIRVVWGIRASNVDLKYYDWLRGFSYWLERRLSPLVKTILVNSRAGQSYAQDQGFPGKNMIVIPNGINSEVFRPDSIGRNRFRELWGVSKGEILIGLVGRLDPMKDHPTFLQAAAVMLKARHDIRYICVGDGPHGYRLQLQELSRDLGLDHRLVWAGVQDDMSSVYNAMDLACSSSSFGEGFSNAIGEAMACGVPCVVTDVGDSAWIVGSTGEVVPISNPQALVDGWRRMLDRLQEYPSCREDARKRIVEHFGLKTLIDNTESVLRNLG